jgi:acetyltransferase-like isoleucine patch superfamily enzyme
VYRSVVDARARVCAGATVGALGDDAEPALIGMDAVVTQRSTVSPGGRVSRASS